MSSRPAPPAIGASVPRKEAAGKLTGEALYVDDLTFPGLFHGVTVRSPVPRGRIRAIRFEEGIPWEEFTVVTARDIPGRNVVKLIAEDQPLLAHDLVNHAEEAIVLLAHPDRYLAELARERVQVEIDPLPAVLTLEDSQAVRERIWGEDNVQKRIEIVKGDVDAVWAQAWKIVEGEYRTGASEQLYIENNGMIAQADRGAGEVTVWGSLQCPFYVKPAVCEVMGLPEDKVRIVQMETGGGFGGKEDYPSILAGHAALLAWKSGRPVKMCYDREEDMAATTKRHPSLTRHRTAVDREGRLLAMDIEFLLDGGAYVTLTPVVLSRGSIHAAGPYRCDHVRVRAQALATNHPPHGAYRGFGNPQSFFALERHMDKVAEACGLTPEELRRRNFLRDGDTTATGQVVRDGVDMAALLDRTLAALGYHEKRARFERENAQGGLVRRGVGFACFFHGSGFTGGGETYLASVAGARTTADGRVEVLASSTEIGQGTNTILCQIAADALKLPYDLVRIARPDTSQVPNSGPTVASRTCMIVGRLVEQACEGLVARLRQEAGLPEGYTPEEFVERCRAAHQALGPLEAFSQYRKPAHVQWDDANYRGDAYAAYGWAVYAAEVSVDMLTCEARVEDFVAAQEVGRVVHPVLAAGQVEGGVAQGIGFALSEQVVYVNGRMVNNQMTNYIMPTSLDLPPIQVLFQEVPYAGGPGGAKGVGELPLDGPAPAVANALAQALDRPVDRVPATPEVLMEVVCSKS